MYNLLEVNCSSFLSLEFCEPLENFNKTMNKTCPRCKISKPPEQFSKCKKNKDGLQYSCKECDFKRTHALWSKNKTKYIEIARLSSIRSRKSSAQKIIEIKKLSKCKYCNEKDWRCLDFHHINPSKKKETISRLVSSSYSWKTINREIQKCELICANCHRITDIATQLKVKDDSNNYRLRNRKLVNDFKKKCGCTKCGFNKNVVALDLHHEDPKNKRSNVSWLLNKNQKIVIEEMQKCIVLCANCHRKHHSNHKE